MYNVPVQRRFYGAHDGVLHLLNGVVGHLGSARTLSRPAGEGRCSRRGSVRARLMCSQAQHKAADSGTVRHRHRQGQPLP